MYDSKKKVGRMLQHDLPHKNLKKKTHISSLWHFELCAFQIHAFNVKTNDDIFTTTTTTKKSEIKNYKEPLFK